MSFVAGPEFPLAPGRVESSEYTPSCARYHPHPSLRLTPVERLSCVHLYVLRLQVCQGDYAAYAGNSMGIYLEDGSKLIECRCKADIMASETTADSSRFADTQATQSA